MWLIPALPLAGFLLNLVAGRRLGDPRSGWLATLAVAGSFVLSVALFVDLLGRDAESRQLTSTLFDWVPAGNLRIGLGLLADPLSVTMCLFVTGIGALIHLYAIGYMKGDEKFPTFFVYLNLFVVAMLMLVLGDNLLVTFLGWEGVGACSYFLISFWFDDEANASAGKKAFVTNRVGDWGFMVAMFLTWTTVGSINYLDIAGAAEAGQIATVTATALTVLFFVAACGKSAQLPLFVWLPDAMAGPTPVSALIHAATMVTAGVYLLVRLNPVLELATWANALIGWVGAITALVAATIAIAQRDIKKVLAYSTVSQLGFMVMAVGAHAYTAAIFHMVTHAFFKALLFLGAGSVIHAMAHEQDMSRYGNLRRYLPITAGTFIAGWIAIIGIPPLAGFWSKDEILGGAFHEGGSGYAWWVIGLVTALLTAFYMTRLVILTFFGEERWRDLPAADHADHADHGAEGHDHHGLTGDHTPHESPWVMTLPLVVLAGLSIVGGGLNLPFGHATEFLGRWLEPVVGEHATNSASTTIVLAVIATLVAVAGLIGAYLVYVRERVPAEKIERVEFARGWYIDESYARFFGGPGRKFFEACAWFDRTVIDGAVNGVGFLVQGAGNQIRRIQTGQVRTYAFTMAAGAVAILVFIVTRMGF
jgi:NADH-quinone oxidoreductase subunit L